MAVKIQGGQKITTTKTISKTGRRDLRGIEIEIQSKPSIISHNPLDFISLIYGPKGIGKTDFINQWGKDQGSTYFLMFEKLARHLSIRQSLMADQINKETGDIEATAWLVAEAYLDHLINNPGNIRTISPDGLGAAFDKALIQACREGGFKHPGGQNDYGASWDEVKRVFFRFTDKIVDSNFGVVFSCHDTFLERETFDGVKNQITPDVPKKADEFIRIKIDNVFYYHYRKRERWLQLRGDELVYGKCAPKENFLTTNGEPIWMVPMGDSAEESYQNFMNAFNNKQRKSYREITNQDIDELNKMRGDTTIRKTKEKRK